MASGQRRSALSYIPGYKNNAVLQLIIFCACSYLAFAIIWALIMIIYSGSPEVFTTYFMPNVAMGDLAHIKAHPWVILTYGWLQYPNTFFELISNMLWLYCFGSIVQMLVGHKQIFPLFVYSISVGGAMFALTQLLPLHFQGHGFVLGSNAGLMGLAVAAITLTPQYRFYLTETFTIPLMVVAAVFIGLMILGTGFQLPALMLLVGGGLTGFIYVLLLRNGYRPGNWAYVLSGKIESLFTPSEKANNRSQTYRMNTSAGAMFESRKHVPQSRIDEILDKINQKGYNSLSKEEKEMLLRAGKE